MELKIMNMEQVAFYVSHGIQPIRLDIGFNDKVVFIYDKDETNKLYGEWLTLKRKEKEARMKYLSK